VQPETSYARLGEDRVAYQVLGQGPPDLVLTMGAFGHVRQVRGAAWLRRAADLGGAGGHLGHIEQFLTGVRPAPPPARVLATVLFTDIVGSTRRAAELGDRRWRELLDTHDGLAARLVERWGGRLVKTTGDGVLATFDGPGRAIGCATARRQQLADLEVQVRAGLHTGEVELRGADVGGMAVHIAARVLAAAGDGEVVVSRTVRDLVVGSEVVLEDRGSRRLRGVEGDWQLYAVAG
jgi:class 3 adenylate cyclase